MMCERCHCTCHQTEKVNFCVQPLWFCICGLSSPDIASCVALKLTLCGLDLHFNVFLRLFIDTFSDSWERLSQGLLARCHLKPEPTYIRLQSVQVHAVLSVLAAGLRDIHSWVTLNLSSTCFWILPRSHHECEFT